MDFAPFACLSGELVRTCVTIQEESTLNTQHGELALWWMRDTADALRRTNSAANTRGKERSMMEKAQSTVPRSVLLLVALVILGSCFGNLSQTALNAMFSGIATDFGVSVGMGQWVTTLYMLVLGVTVPAVTYLSRRFTEKQVALAAFSLMFVGAVIDMLAQDFVTLIIGRVFQAMAAGITMPLMMSVIMVSFPPGQQATAMGVSGIAMGFAPNIGPTIGGWMIDAAGWRSFFVALSAAALLLIIAGAFLIKDSGTSDAQARLDVLSLLLSAFAFGCLLLGFSNASSFSLTEPFVWVPIIVGVVALIGFIARQKRVDHPLISMDIFASRKYVIGFWATTFLFTSFLGITLIIPLYIEGLCGGTAFEAGLALLPGTIAALIFNPLAGVLTDKIGIRPVVVVFSIALVGGSVAMVFVDENTPFWAVVAMQGLRASGVSGLIGPLTSWSLEELPHQIMTDGSSFSTAVRQAGASMGTALMVFMITVVPTISDVDALGYQCAFGVSAAFALLMFMTVIAKVKSN